MEIINGTNAYAYLSETINRDGILSKCGSDLFRLESIFSTGLSTWDFFANFEKINSSNDVVDAFEYFLGATTPESAVCIVIHIPQEVELKTDDFKEMHRSVSTVVGEDEYIPNYFIVGATRIKYRSDYWTSIENQDSYEFYSNPNYFGNLTEDEQRKIINEFQGGYDYYGKSI